MNNINAICENIIKNGATGFVVFEDSGGGLYLAVWYDDGSNEETFDENFYCHVDYEYNHGQLVEDLEALAEGYHPSDWENMKDMTRQEWRDMVNTPYAGEVILDEDGLSEKLGAAGKTEFADFLEVEED